MTFRKCPAIKTKLGPEFVTLHWRKATSPSQIWISVWSSPSFWSVSWHLSWRTLLTWREGKYGLTMETLKFQFIISSSGLSDRKPKLFFISSSSTTSTVTSATYCFYTGTPGVGASITTCPSNGRRRRGLSWAGLLVSPSKLWVTHRQIFIWLH